MQGDLEFCRILHSWVGQICFTSQVRFIGSYYQDFLIFAGGFNYICLMLIPTIFLEVVMDTFPEVH